MEPQGIIRQGEYGIIAENAVGEVIVVGIGVGVVVHVVGGVQLPRHQQELSPRAHPCQAQIAQVGVRALEGAGGVLEGTQRGLGALAAFIEVKAVAEIEFGGQVQAAARGMIAEEGDIGQQGAIVGGEIRFSVQAAARQPRVIESELGGISDAVPGKGGFELLRSGGNRVFPYPGVRFRAGIAEDVGTVQIRHHLERPGRKPFHAGGGGPALMLEQHAGPGGDAGRPPGDLFFRTHSFHQAGAYFPAFQGFHAQAAFRVQVGRGSRGGSRLLGEDGVAGGRDGDGARGRKNDMSHMDSQTRLFPEVS